MKLNLRAALVWPWVKKHWFISGLALLIGSCAFMTRDRTVTWEEEVPLNTGETIWVTRTGTYSYRSSSGNPLDYDHRPDRLSTIEFTYKGKQYAHTGEVSFNLIAIDPDSAPNLVGNPGQWGNKHKYPCDAPYYVQFRLSPDGREWIWPNRIDTWLYNLPTNLILGLADIEEDGKKFTPSDRQTKNASAFAYSHARYIDPTYLYDGCIRRK